MQLEYSILYALTLQELKTRYGRLVYGQVNESQFLQGLNTGQIADGVAFRAFSEQIWRPPERLHREDPQSAGYQFPNEDTKMIRSILWQLVGLGILIPRQMLDERNQFFDISEYGGRVLSQTAESPYDPFEFNRRMRETAPLLEPDTFEFLKEAVACFLGRYFRASAVMIGLASENEVLKLIELFRNTLGPSGRPSYSRAIGNARTLRSKFDVLYSRLRSIRGTLPYQIRELDTWLLGTFQVIRMHRNDAGHPTGLNPSSEDVFGTLSLFLTYANRLSQLKEHLLTQAQASS